MVLRSTPDKASMCWAMNFATVIPEDWSRRILVTVHRQGTADSVGLDGCGKRVGSSGVVPERQGPLATFEPGRGRHKRNLHPLAYACGRRPRNPICLSNRLSWPENVAFLQVKQWSCRESNPGPTAFPQDFSVRSSLCLYSDLPVTQTSRDDDPSRCLMSPRVPRPNPWVGPSS